MGKKSLYDAISKERYHIYLRGLDGIQRRLVQDATGLEIDWWLKEYGSQCELYLVVENAVSGADVSAREWIDMREHEKEIRDSERNEEVVEDPLEFLSELNRIADRNMRVRKILMTVMSQTVRNMNDENKNDRRKAIGLGEILESSTAEILELFEE